MKRIIFILTLLLSISVSASSGGDKKKKSAESDDSTAKVENTKPSNYIAGILARGESWGSDSLKASQLQESHVEFLKKLKTENQLIASGPLTTSSEALGLYIFNVETIAEAEKLVAQDESIAEGWLTISFHKWSTRDYDEPKKIEEETSVLESSSGMSWQRVLGLVIVATTVVLVLRTFRNQASV